MCDALADAVATPQLYARRKEDLHDDYRMCQDPLLPGTKSASAVYNGGPYDPPRGAPAPGEMTARINALQDRLFELRDRVAEARRGELPWLQDRNGPLHSDWAALARHVTPPPPAERRSTAPHPVGGGSPLRGAGRATAAAAPAPAARTAPAPLHSVPLEFHVDSADKNGGRTESETGRIGTEETGLTTIFAHAGRPCPNNGGTSFIVRGPDGVYPRSNFDANSANDYARAGMNGAERYFSGNGHRNGGTYFRGYLGKGGVFHGADPLAVSSRRWIGYASETVHQASRIRRRALTLVAARSHTRGAPRATHALLPPLCVCSRNACVLRVRPCRHLEERGQPGASTGVWPLERRAAARRAGRMRQPLTFSGHKAAAAERLYTFTPAEMDVVTQHVRYEHCAGLLLTLFLRMLRWHKADEAFGHFLARMHGNFAPSTIPFVERRFTQGHAAMEKLAAALAGRAPSAVNVALFRVIHVVARLAAVAHTEVLLQLCEPRFLDLLCRVEDLDTVVDGVMALLAACWSWRKAAAQGWPGHTSFPRALPVNLPNSQFWRNRRFGNGIAKDGDSPPSATLPTLSTWAGVRRLVAAVVSVPSAEATRVLGLDAAEWIRYVTRHLAGSADVWATVTARERRWYGSFLATAARPSPVDVPQPIGAGALKGFLWQVSKVLPSFNFNGPSGAGGGHTVTQGQVAAVLEAVRDDRDAYALAFEKARADVLGSYIDTIADRTARLQATEALAAFQPMLDKVRDMGPPTFATAENGECDGAKAREGWVDCRQRKGAFLAAERSLAGDLAQPHRVLLMGSEKRASDGATLITQKWVECV